jgi:hypothetical protein
MDSLRISGNKNTAMHSYRIALTGMSRIGSKIEIVLSGKSSQGEQVGSAGSARIVHDVMRD